MVSISLVPTTTVAEWPRCTKSRIKRILALIWSYCQLPKEGTISRFSGTVQGGIKELQTNGDHDGDKNWANEPAAVFDDGAAAESGAQQLTDAHRDSGSKQHVIAREEHNQRSDVAREVHHFGVGGGAGEVEAQQENIGHGPKRTGAGAEKSVVESNRQTGPQIEGKEVYTRGSRLVADRRVKKKIKRNGNEQDRNCLAQVVGIDALDQNGSGYGANRRENDSVATIPPTNQGSATVMEGGA